MMPIPFHFHLKMTSSTLGKYPVSRGFIEIHKIDSKNIQTQTNSLSITQRVVPKLRTIRNLRADYILTLTVWSLLIVVLIYKSPKCYDFKR